MPNVPKWVADQLENLLSSKFIDVEVASTVLYSPEIKRVTFSGNLTQVNYFPGSAMVFRAGDKELRHYTPYAFNKIAGTFDIIFHLHGNGPGSDLAERLMPGDRLKVSIPSGKKFYDKEKTFHFFFGDETSLSFYAALMDEINKNHQWARGIFELNQLNLNVLEDMGYDVKTVLRTPNDQGAKAIELFTRCIQAKPELFNQSVFYLTGNVTSIQKIKSLLKSNGISSKNIKVQGYWVKDSIGL